MHMHSRITILAACLALAIAGCAKDPKDNLPAGCGFGPSVTADPPAAVEGPASFDTRTGTAMNQVDLEMLSQLPQPRLMPMRRGPCGVVGLAFRRTIATGSGTELAYNEILDETGTAPGVLEAVTSAAAGVDPGLYISLFYESDCRPVILVADGSDWVEHTRGAAGWTAEPAGLDLAALTGAAGSISPVSADVTRDGTFHVFGHSGGFLIHGSRSQDPGASWTFSALDQAPGTGVFQYRMDSTGSIHAVFEKTEYPCDPCDVTLYYGRLGPGGGWTDEVVQEGTWGPPLDLFSDSPWLLVDPSDRPMVVAHFQRRVVTGSFQSTELRAYVWEDGEGGAEGGFCAETVATESDAYQGGDGDGFTGALPVAGLDASGRVHATWLDMSIWHDATGYMNEIRGQIRHASRGTNSWSVARLGDQPGQSESPNPLVGYGAPLMVVLPDNAGVVIAAVQHTWETDSIYNSTDLPVTWVAHAFVATW